MISNGCGISTKRGKARNSLPDPNPGQKPQTLWRTHDVDWQKLARAEHHAPTLAGGDSKEVERDVGLLRYRKVKRLAAVFFGCVLVGPSFPATATDPGEAARAAEQAAEAAKEGTGLPALSEAQAAGYLDGKAMWHASVAEQHHYPTPHRVFEHAEALELTEGQRRATTRLHEETRLEAIRLGTELVALEQRLNRIFVWNQATAENIEGIVHDIGTLQTQFRLTHLVAGIRQKPLLTEEQVRRYDELQGRGMVSGKSSNQMGCSGAHHHGR
jgi:hypothetical protein